MSKLTYYQQNDVSFNRPGLRVQSAYLDYVIDQEQLRIDYLENYLWMGIYLAIVFIVVGMNVLFTLFAPTDSPATIHAQLDRFYSTQRGTSVLKSIDGIRSLSTLYIVIYHCGYYAGAYSQGSQNPRYLLEMWFTTWYATLFTSGFIAVDAFFLLSGLLASYTTIRKLNRIGQKYGSFRFWAGYVLNRYLRLTPMLVLTAYFGFMIRPLLYDGPINSKVTASYESCKTEQWIFFTYIFNLYPMNVKATEQPCISWTWYLANDFQFYLIAPLFIVAYQFRRWLGYLLCCAVLVASLGVNYASHYLYKSTPAGVLIGVQTGSQCIPPPSNFSEAAKQDWPFYSEYCPQDSTDPVSYIFTKFQSGVLK